MYLLFPGRHHLLSSFQLEEMTRITESESGTLIDIDGKNLEYDGRIDTVIWAVTSANHSHTRRNPLPLSRREVAIEKFCEQLDAKSFVYGIDDLGTTKGFAEYVIKKIFVDSDGMFDIRPENTIVGCSTPAVIGMYEKLGFRILPFELVDRESVEMSQETPWELVQAIVKAGNSWRTDETFLRKVSRATRELYKKYSFGDLIVRLHEDPIYATSDGDITETRDYNTYVRSFDGGAERKYELVKDILNPGKIVDIGCCTGALIRELSFDDLFRESDFYGIEIARKLYRECIQRKEEENYFGNDNVFFFQRNVAAGKIFPDDFIDTFTTFSLTHEVESYQGRTTLKKFMGLLYEQLALHGKWVNVDVVGPENKDDIIFMKLNKEDGSNESYDREFPHDMNSELKAYLDGLSTFSKFLRFARDFRKEEGETIDYSVETIDGVEYVKIRLQDACEFLSKKDYTDNWNSEMHETFAYWSIDDWKRAAEEVGFTVNPDSRVYRNEWIVENRFRGKAELYSLNGDELKQMEYPVTNILLIADKN